MRRLAYFLAGSPRTGSSLLGATMTATGVLGRPEEYFWKGQEAAWARQFGLEAPTADSYEQYVRTVIQRTRSANGVFGSKLFWRHLHDLLDRSQHFSGLSGLSAGERFRATFGPDIRAVFIRRNCVDAAVSLWRAEATGVWLLRPGDVRPAVPEVLDTSRVTALHAEYHAAEIGWPNFLQLARVPYMVVAYREISADVTGVVADVAKFLGVDLSTSLTTAPAPHVRQADAATTRFVQQWVTATGGCVQCGATQ